MIKQFWRWLFGRGDPRQVTHVSRNPTIVPAWENAAPLRANEVFTPTKPRVGRKALIGRQEEIETIVQALTEDKAHVVLYSERGRGKTSLSNIIVEGLRRSGLIVAQHSCEAGSTFDSIIHGLARSLPETLLATPVRAEKCEGCEAALPAGPLRPADIVSLLPRLSVKSLTCVIDEFDRVVDSSTRTRLADTIKQLSDRGLPLVFMVVGVSESLEEILGQHPSIQRNLVSVHLPLLSTENIMGLVEKGSRAAGLSYSPELVEMIALVAGGMPYVAQLLGLRVAQIAARRGSTGVGIEALKAAAQRMIREMPPQTLARLTEITASGEDADLLAALRRVATASNDVWGHMSVGEAGKDGVIVGGMRIDRPSWLAMHECGVLEPSPARPGFASFADRGLRQYILLQSVVDGTLGLGREPRSVLREMQEAVAPIQRIGR
jgi:hypothetical protein